MKYSPDNHLSGSVMAAWLGYNPWQSPYQVLENARSERQELDSLQIDIGTAVEPVILERGLRSIGLDRKDMYSYEDNPDHDTTYLAKKHPELELYYSDDGLINVDGVTIKTDPSKNIYVMNDAGEVTLDGLCILEAKYTTMLPASDHQPPLYRGPIQLQVGMMCHKAKHGILFTCYGGRELHVHVFDSHESTQKIIYDGVISFEEHYAAGTYPDPISIEEVGKLYPEASDDSVKLAVDLMDSVNSYREAQEAIKQAEIIRKREAMKLMEALGEASSGVIPGFEADTKINWPMRNYKPKPATCCPECGFEIEPAKDGYSVRQKSITIKEVSNA
jgi:hypothetical protein